MALATASRIRAGEAYVRITTDNSALVRGLENAKQHLRDFGQSLKGVGADMMQLAGAISLPLAFSAKEFADIFALLFKNHLTYHIFFDIMVLIKASGGII